MIFFHMKNDTIHTGGIRKNSTFNTAFKPRAMKSSLTTLLLLLCSCITLTAQQFDWVTNYEVRYQFSPGVPRQNLCKGNNSEIWTARNDSIVSAGSMKAFGTQLIERRSQNGNVLQTIQLGTEAHIVDMIVDPNDQLFIAGYFINILDIDGQDTLQHSGGVLVDDPFLLCFAANGNLLWKRNLNAGLTNDVLLYRLALSPNGWVYYARTNFTDGYICRLDTNGHDAAQVVLGNVRTIGDIAFDPNGNLFVAGGTGNGAPFTAGGLSVNVPDSYMMFLLRLNNMGLGSWVHFAHDITFQTPHLTTDAFGNAYIAGELFDTLSWGNLQFQGPDWVYDFFLAKVDSNGTFLWGKEAPNPTGGIVGDFQLANFRSINADPNGNIVLCGNQRGSIDWGFGIQTSNPILSQYNLGIVYFDASGQTQWAKNITDSSAYKQMHQVMHQDGNWYFSASLTQSPNITFDTINIALPYFQNALFARISNTTTGIEETATDNLSLYPNPGTGIFQLPNHIRPQSPICVYNTEGRLVKQVPMTEKQIDLRQFPKGMYLINCEGLQTKIILE
jgi:hypothetical protein